MKSSPHQRPKGCTTRKNKGHLRQHAPSWKTMWGSSAHVPFRCCLSTEFIMLKRRWLTTPGMGQLWQKQVTGVFISRVQRNYPGPRKNNPTYTAERMHKIRITQPNVTLLPWIKGYLKAASNTKRMNCREASPSLSSVDVVLEATKRWERINCLSFLFSPHTRIRILVNTLMAREQRIFHVEPLRTKGTMVLLCVQSSNSTTCTDTVLGSSIVYNVEVRKTWKQYINSRKPWGGYQKGKFLKTVSQ
jgi:hypothetical protein